MSYAVEIIVTGRSLSDPRLATPARRLPFLHDTIQEARNVSAHFLEQNGAYIASKTSDQSIAMYQVVDHGGDLVVAPTGRLIENNPITNLCECPRLRVV